MDLLEGDSMGVLSEPVAAPRYFGKGFNPDLLIFSISLQNVKATVTAVYMGTLLCLVGTYLVDTRVFCY